MKKTLSILLFGVAIAVILHSACGRKGPEDPPDTTPPAVAFTNPGYGEQDVPINAAIEVTFSEDVDPSTINNQTVVLAQSGNPVSGSVTYGGRTAVFTPDSNMSVNSVHTLSIDVGVRDVSGNEMAAPYFCTFTTGVRIAATTTYRVTPSAGPNGTISPDSPQDVTENRTVAFTLTPDAGYSIASVTGCGGALSENTYTTAPITADCTVTAAFAGGGGGVVTHTLSAIAETNGSISPAGDITVNHGGSQSFSISPDSGYKIAAVLVDGRSVGTPTSYTFKNVTADHTIEASFKAKPLTITASAGKGGKISCTPSWVNYGSDSFCVIVPDHRYSIDKVLVDGDSVGRVTSYDFINVTTSHTIKAYFKKGDDD